MPEEQHVAPDEPVAKFLDEETQKAVKQLKDEQNESVKQAQIEEAVQGEREQTSDEAPQESENEQFDRPQILSPSNLDVLTSARRQDEAKALLEAERKERLRHQAELMRQLPPDATTIPYAEPPAPPIVTAIVNELEAPSMKRRSSNTREMEHEAVQLQNAKIRQVALIDDGTAKSRPLTEAERRQIMHLLDLSEHERMAQKTKTEKDKVPKGHKLTHERIAELTNRHVNTISKLKRERDKQQCLRVKFEGRMQTMEIPQPKQIGGYRGSRLTDEQQRMCTRIAVENPRLTSTRIRERLQEMFPQLNTLSDTTVWRMLDRSGLHFLRAKMRDPRADGTTAHMAEKEAFLKELRKGEAGELGANNLFFMDETTLYLNETARRAWGTSEHPAEIKHAKGKTVTIGVYAGLGLVSPVEVERKENDWKNFELVSESVGKPKAATDPRGNDFELVDGEWKRTEHAPKFMLFWWLRPPTRKKLVLSRFLTTQDILDPNMVFSNTIPEGKPHFGGAEQTFSTFEVTEMPTGSTEHLEDLKESTASIKRYIEKHPPEKKPDQQQYLDYILPIRSHPLPATFTMQIGGTFYNFSLIQTDEKAAEFSFVDSHGRVNYENVKAFLSIKFDLIRDPSELAETLWMNNIEWRQVDDAGELVNITTSGKTKKKVILSSDAMLRYLDGLKSLIARAVLLSVPTEIDDNVEIDNIRKNIEEGSPSATDRTTLEQSLREKEKIVLDERRNFLTSFLKPDIDDKIPRGFYTKTGRSYLGGRIEGERGDRALFLEYLRHHVVYIQRAFSSDVRKNLNHAWDSAPQHGKTDVTKNTKSFIHRWVEKHLHVRGAIFLPVREPDFNPVELLFAFIKGVVRRRFPSERGEVSVDDMIRLIDEAFMEVTESMVKGWLRYGCYLIPDDSPEDIKAIERTERCGYEQITNVESVWNRILEIWETRTKANEDASYATIRPKLVNSDRDALHRYVARFATVGDAFRYTKQGTTPHTVKIGNNGYKFMGEKANMRQRIDVHTTNIELLYDGLESSLFKNNFKDDSHMELVKIVTLKTDKTGLTTILHYWAQYTLDRDLIDSLNLLVKFAIGTDGVLSNLAIASKKARALARRYRENLFVPKNTTDVEMLLDVQERVFHPKLDANETVEVTSSKKIRFEAPSRTRVYEMQLGAELSVASNAEVKKARVTKVTSTVVTLKMSGDEINFGNKRICDAITVEDSELMENKQQTMHRELMQTPYAKSVPLPSETGGGNALMCALAVISIKAYEDERERIEHAVSKLVREKILPHVDLSLPPTADAQRRIVEATRHALNKLRRDSSSADDRAKLYNVFNLRAERRANVQLRRLARGDPNERRWPGYPLEERYERDGRPIRLVTEDGSKNDGTEAVENMDQFDVKPIRSIKVLTTNSVMITFENDERQELGTNDHKFLKIVDKKFSTENYAKWELARKRFEQSRKKLDSNWKETANTAKNDVVGEYEGMPIEIKNDTRIRTKDSFVGAAKSPLILFDPTNSVFYPAPHMKISNYKDFHPSVVPVVGLWDRKVTAREEWAEYWWSTDEGENIIDLKDLKESTNIDMNNPRLSIVVHGAKRVVYYPAFKKLTSKLKSIPPLKPYNISIALPEYRVYKLDGEGRSSVYRVRAKTGLAAPAAAPAAAPKIRLRYKNITDITPKVVGAYFSFSTSDEVDRTRGTVSHIMPRVALDRMYRNRSLVDIEEECLADQCMCVVADGEFSIDGNDNLSFSL